ncbi:hypothetical protein APSETT444_004263 [Aspergillus pseudonomiae]
MDKSKPYPQQRKPLFKPTLIIHGGAGALKRSTLPPSLYAQYQTSLLTYLRSTHSLLKSGSTALDAAVHAVTLLEDDELFNCGRGSVFTSAGTIEMEASVMVTSLVSDDSSDYPGSTKRGAGVMGLRNVRHPILAAKESLLRTGYGGEDGGSMHSQLVAPYVEEKAREWGLEFMHDEWFWTQRRWDEHLRGLRGEPEPISFSQGTVGPENRVKRRAAAVSGTGNGDSFLRVAAARTACAMVRFSERTPTLADAVAAVSGPGGELQRSAGRRWGVTREGEGGIIGIEAEVEVDEDTGVPVPGMQLGRGQVVFDFNCGGMWRAWVEEDGDGNDLENVMVFREPY